MRHYLLWAVAAVIPLTLQGQVAERSTLSPQLRIGAADGPEALTTVGSAVLSPDGRLLYVGQPQERIVRVFDATSGKLLRTFGRQGSGPGEFNYVGRLGWRGDTLYVTDMALQRVTMFSPDGDVLKTLRIVSPLLEATRSPALATSLSPDGMVIGEPYASLRPIAAGLVKHIPIVRMTREGEIISTLATRDVSNSASEAASGGRITVFIQPLSEVAFRAFAPNGESLVLVHTPRPTASLGQFSITRFRHDGDTIYSRSYNYQPTPLSAAIVDSIHNAYATVTFARFGEAARARALAEQFVRLPRYDPPVSEALHMSDGSVWLRRTQRNAGAVEWLTLDANGDMRAKFIAPTSLRILDANNAGIWTVQYDELGVPYLVKYLLSSAP